MKIFEVDPHVPVEEAGFQQEEEYQRSSDPTDPITGFAPPAFTPLYDRTQSEKDDIVTQTLERFRESRDEMSLHYPRMIASYRKYRSIAKPLKNRLGKKLRARANLFVPYPWAIVESEMPRLAGRLPRIKAFPRNPGARVKGDAIQDLLFYTFDRMSFIQLQILWLRQHSLYGFSPLLGFWRQEEKRVFARRVDEETGEEEVVAENQTTYDDFWCRLIDCFDSFHQPGVEKFEDGDWYEYREWYSAQDIRARVDAGVFYPDTLDYLEDNLSGQRFSDEGSGKFERDELAKFQGNLGVHGYGKHECLWVLEDGQVHAVLNRQHLARSGDNPNPLQEKPIFNVTLMPAVSEPIGMSTIDQMAGLPEKLNALTNARMDNIALMMNRVILADRFSQTDFSNLFMSPGNVILTDNVDKAVRVLDFPDIGQSSEREILVTKEELQFVNGISDFIVGVKTKSRLADTATGVSTIVREANARFALKLATFEAGPLRRLVNTAHAYNMVYMPRDKQIFISGPKGYEMRHVNIEEILCQCDLIIEPGSTVPLDQISRRESLASLLDRVMRAPQVIDQTRYWSETFAAHDIRNPGEFLLQKEGPLPEAEDAQLAEGENVALRQGQPVEVVGNDRIHLAIHTRPIENGEINNWDEEARSRHESHIQHHTSKMIASRTQALQAGQNSMFGAANGQPGPEGSGGLFGGAGPVQGESGIPAGVGGPIDAGGQGDVAGSL